MPPAADLGMKPSIPQGTRDFGPEIVRKRNYILNIIRNVFGLYGFQPLETPAMENLDTLMGKYGEEGDKLIFKTLKYDLTIPFARYVAMNHGQLTFPFKRYQIQPVWRADRPQKGRYREFYQCDADVVGSNSSLNEIELVLIYHEVFYQLGIRNYELRINHRKILTALAQLCGGTEKMNDIAIAIDKLDKIGLEKVKDELKQKGLNENQLGIIEKYLAIEGNNSEKINALNILIGTTESGRKGIDELNQIFDNSYLSSISYHLDPTLARGLNYYTGIIFEAKAPAEVKIGSIGGGGRYDDLTGLFGVPNIPGVGISFGVDRIYDVMEELNLFPETVEQGTKILFFNLGEEESKTAYQLLQQVRSEGISAEIFHEQAKM